jgi:C-terminal processing protease CtpA/Prc
MAIQKTPRRPRFGAPLVLGTIALIAVAIFALSTEYSEHFGRSDAGRGTLGSQAMELSGIWLGMRLTEANTSTARALGIPPDVKGTVVVELSPDSRALNGGLQPGDVVVEVDAKGIDKLSDLYALASKLDVNRPLSVRILRQGQPLPVVLPLPVYAGLAPQQAASPVALQRGYPYRCPTLPGGGPNPACPMPTWGAR